MQRVWSYSFLSSGDSRIKAIWVRLNELIEKINAIGQAVEEIEEYSYKFNFKILG